MKKIQTLTIFLILSFFFLTFSNPVLAVVLYLEPSEAQYHPDDTFITEIRIDTEKECINAVDINLSFPQDILEVKNFSKGNSILTLWIKTPNISNMDAINRQGLISFSGGIPAGYCGKMPQDPNASNLLGKIIFKVRGANANLTNETIANLKFLENSQVLLNDGMGTPAELISQEANFTISPEKLETPKNEWQEKLEKDIIPPEPFKIEIYQDQSTFEGKYFIAFSTTDKQTGINYFEIKEGTEDWKITKSPYLLKNQELKSIIKVKAVDKAGNERIAEYTPKKKLLQPLYWIIIFVIILIIVAKIIITKLKSNYEN